jgi:predicted TIM-barrel fold metal-dependent hydrolase
MEVQSSGQTFEHRAEVSSVLCRGVPAKCPDLRFVCLEAGLSWVPFLYRLDTEVLSRPNETPLLEKRPTEYFKDQFWVSCQPMEEVQGFAGIEHLAEFCGGWDRVVFSSDWPHWDFDSPAIVREVVPHEHRTKVWSENAKEAFDL